MGPADRHFEMYKQLRQGSQAPAAAPADRIVPSAPPPPPAKMPQPGRLKGQKMMAEMIRSSCGPEEQGEA